GLENGIAGGFSRNASADFRMAQRRQDHRIADRSPGRLLESEGVLGTAAKRRAAVYPRGKKSVRERTVASGLAGGRNHRLRFFEPDERIVCGRRECGCLGGILP